MQVTQTPFAVFRSGLSHPPMTSLRALVYLDPLIIKSD